MTREEAIIHLDYLKDFKTPDQVEALNMAIKALEEPSYNSVKSELDAISRQDALDCLTANGLKKFDFILDARDKIKNLPPVKPQEPKTGHCKDCKYFEYDSVAKVDGIPIIVAHEICKRWGDGCKTKEDGYCFLFEPQESEVQE